MDKEKHTVGGIESGNPGEPPGKRIRLAEPTTNE